MFIYHCSKDYIYIFFFLKEIDTFIQHIHQIVSEDCYIIIYIFFKF